MIQNLEALSAWGVPCLRSWVQRCPAGLGILGELEGMRAVRLGAGMEVSLLNSQLPISTKPFKELSSLH